MKSYGDSSAEAAYLDEVRQRKETATAYMLRAQRLIAAVPEYKLRLLLRLRYVDGMLWEELADEMCYSLRWVFRLHCKALAYIAAASLKLQK